MLNQICILNPPDGDQFKFFEELGCHKEILAYVLVQAKKLMFSYFTYGIQIEILKPLLLLLLFQECNPVGFFMKKQILGLSLPGKTPQTLETSELHLNCDGSLDKSSSDTTLYDCAAAVPGTTIKSSTR